MFNTKNQLLKDIYNLRVTCDFASIDLECITKLIRNYVSYPSVSLVQAAFLLDIATRIDKVSETLRSERPFKKYD